MLSACEVVAFVATAAPAAAAAFYRDALGFALVEDSPFALVFDLGNGGMLRVQKVDEHQPARHTVLGWRVADIHREIVELVVRGVRFNRYPPMAQDAAGVWRAPGGDLVAWFSDPDGNTLSLTQFAERPQLP